jgi:putative holliday junction resolvase
VTATPGFRAGVRLGIDVGSVRIGVARSDAAGLLAIPIETVKRGNGDLERILALAEEYSAIELVVGLPIALSGDETASTVDARNFAQRLADAKNFHVWLIDERLTTVSAHSAMRQVGRSTRESRAVIDQVSAVIILQHALDGERSVGSPPGTVVKRTKDFEL